MLSRYLRRTVAGFLIPFVFVYHPDIVLIEGFTIVGLAWALGAFFLSTAGIATALGGYSISYIGIVQRVIRFAAGVAILIPDPLISAISAAVIVVSFGIEKVMSPVETEQTSDQAAE